MSESDSSIRQKLRALAYALGAVSIQVVRMRRFSRSFHSWFEVKGPDAIPGVRYPRDVLDAAAEFVEKVATADQMLDAIPVSALEPRSGLAGGVRWDVRTRRTLRAIQHETAILECHSRDPEGLLLGLCWMGEDGLKQMQSKLDESLLELTQRILDLNSLPDDLSDPTDASSGQQRAHQVPVANSNGTTKSDDDSIKPSLEQENSTETDETLPKKIRKNSPSRVKAKAAFDYAMQQIPNADKMTAVELFDAICDDGEAKELLPPSAESFTKYLNDCGIRLRKSDTKPTGRSVVRRSDT